MHLIKQMGVILETQCVQDVATRPKLAIVVLVDLGSEDIGNPTFVAAAEGCDKGRRTFVLEKARPLRARSQPSAAATKALGRGHFLRQPQKRRWQTRVFALLEAVQVFMDYRRILKGQHP